MDLLHLLISQVCCKDVGVLFIEEVVVILFIDDGRPELLVLELNLIHDDLDVQLQRVQSVPVLFLLCFELFLAWTLRSIRHDWCFWEIRQLPRLSVVGVGEVRWWLLYVRDKAGEIFASCRLCNTLAASFEHE